MIMDNAKFVYVFSVQDKELLLSLGYHLIKSDDRLDIYVFDNSGVVCFSDSDIECVLTNTLTF